jgi:mannan endo-1,4-beta-mannosidase
MYDRFVNVHKLNNLLWVWSPNAPNVWSDPYASTYPGADKVDILAADIYENDYQQKYYDSLLSLAAGKPIAIGENGEVPNLEKLQQSQSKWTYMMSWGKMLYDNNSADTIKTFMNSNYTLTRDKLNTSLVPKPSAAPAPAPSEEEGEAAIPLAKGLAGEYYNNIQLSGAAALTRTDAMIDFNWRLGSPDAALGIDRFSIRWSGKIKPLYEEQYTFYTTSDDGIRVWVNGESVIDSWTKQSGTERKGTITLTAGQLYDIKVEYYENEGDARVRLMWESASQAKETVPASALFLPDVS